MAPTRVALLLVLVLAIGCRISSRASEAPRSVARGATTFAPAWTLSSKSDRWVQNGRTLTGFGSQPLASIALLNASRGSLDSRAAPPSLGTFLGAPLLVGSVFFGAVSEGGGGIVPIDITLETDRASIVAVDASDPAPAPRVLARLEHDERFEEAAADGSSFYAAIGRLGGYEGETRETASIVLRAFDAPAGVTRWKVALPTYAGASQLAAANGRVVVAGHLRQRSSLLSRTKLSAREKNFEGPTQLAYAICFDAKTGDELWHAVVHGNQIAADGNHVVFVRERELVVIDGQSGEAKYFTAPIDDAKPTLDGDRVYLNRSLDIAAVDLAGGTVLWESKVPWSMEVPTATKRLAVGHAAVIVSDTGNVIHALDRRTGRETWQWGVGYHVKALFVVDTDDGERLVVDTYDAGTGEKVLRGFAPAPATPLEEVDVEGRRVLEGECVRTTPRVVMVNGLETALDEQGAFRIHLKARGALSLRVPDGPEYSRTLPPVTLDGAGRYRFPDVLGCSSK